MDFIGFWTLKFYLFCVNDYLIFIQLVYKELLKWGAIVPA